MVGFNNLPWVLKKCIIEIYVDKCRILSCTLEQMSLGQQQQLSKVALVALYLKISGDIGSGATLRDT